MKKLSARRRHPLAAFVVLIFALAATGGLYAALAPAGEAKADASETSIAIEEGQKLYAVGCASCHGAGGQGSSDGPTLVGVGAAAVDFQVSTGRMPMQQPGPQAPTKPNIYTEEEIAQLAAYIASLGPGPGVPEPAAYDPSEGNAAHGGELFRTNCSQCHNFTGQGGALTHGKYAPNLHDVDPKHIYQAMLTGPQAMPSFPDAVLPPEQKRDIIAWLTAVNTSESPSEGGFGLGGFGPVAEGLFAWTIGIGLLVAVAVWVAAHTAKARKS
ncbi:cytochrome bc1 complex diheme cytochrome c subunit [Streptomyces alkaliphilus]|uniref:Cytochrome bc1 complex cytochrome c subunit n=1 Tax=Streptomyces alkaliphilus TaxID=1472722 RepID=A0A7W3TBJ0_9ACTN|nr:c-type cytochrome [Streptomyces alkaliphilus]MBB0243811.1 c-type cytochrome [Streptomyces alkaliphilus]MQS07128.1 c-type cytochrome [Streptomyces alkaliphilus]